MNKIITAGCVALAATTALAMPNKQELAKAKPLVEAQTKADLTAYKAGNMTAKNVADSHVLLAQKAGSQAEKYLLYQGAFKLYARSGEYDLAAEAIGALKREIKDLPPAAIAEIVGDELRYVSDAKAPRLVALLKEAQNSLAKNQLDKIEKIIIEGKNTIDGTIWSYRIQDGNVEIVGVSPNPKGAVSIPATINGAKVTRIGNDAFRYCTELTLVTIPSSVKSIESQAFFHCGLKSVTIPDGVVKSGAFRSCTELATVVLSSSVTQVEAGAFSQCGALVSYSVDSGNPVYSSRNGMLCSKDGSRLVAGVNSGLAIPAGVTSIAEGAFVGLGSIKSVTIPPSVTNIEIGAFAGTISVRVDEGNAHYKSEKGLLLTKDGTTLLRGTNGDVTIPIGVTTIVNGAFGGCNVKSVKMPSSVKSFGNAFFYCGSLESVSISENVTDIGRGAFQRCESLKSIAIPSSVSHINAQAFWCAGLESVTIPASVKKIGHGAFHECNDLKKVTMLGERPETPVNDVFDACKKLTAIHVPANAKSWAGMKEWQGKPLVFDAKTENAK